jgi:hypothetical protein
MAGRVRPHGFRHHAITRALDLTSGDLRRVQRFSRHRDPRTVLRYDDNRRDLGGEVASLVANETETFGSATGDEVERESAEEALADTSRSRSPLAADGR